MEWERVERRKGGERGERRVFEVYLWMNVSAEEFVISQSVGVRHVCGGRYGCV